MAGEWFGVVTPKLLSFREVELWKHRFDPIDHRSLRGIEREFGLERHLFGTAQEKLKWNIRNNCLQPIDLELINLAKQITEVEGPISEELIDQLVFRRTHQVNWETQRQRFLNRKRR